jgi:hypothetical protein
VAAVNTISLKLVELAPLSYFTATSILFAAYPQTLANPAYSPWGVLDTRQWAAIIAAFVVCHAAALWWNGRNRIASRVARATALLGYLWVSLTFGGMFVAAGIPWGAVLFWLLMPMLCGALFLRIVNEAKLLYRGW